MTSRSGLASLTLAVAAVGAPRICALRVVKPGIAAFGPQGAKEFEADLDRLSWQVYNGNALRPNVTSATDTAGTGAVGETARRAAARIERFLRADAGGRGSARSAIGSHGITSPYCPQHIPENDPYWQETENYDETHHGYIKCDLSDGCSRPVTNADRVRSLRRALKGTAALLGHLGIDSLLYGGSAIGYYRCGDVIPWDVDCDVLVDKADITKIHQAAFGQPLDWQNFQAGGWSSGDLGHMGAHGIRLSKKTPCTPFEVVDTRTGFFCDVFVADWVGGYSAALFTPWWSGPSRCAGVFPECAAAGGTENCIKFPRRTIEPTQPCAMAGTAYRCPADLEGYLVTTYGEGIYWPNRTISTGSG